jgi:hypothetical protein
MQKYVFELAITSEKYLDYYRGLAHEVVARCVNGQTIQFPASLLTQFVTVAGIHGRFVLTCNDKHRGAVLQRLPAEAPVISRR